MSHLQQDSKEIWFRKVQAPGYNDRKVYRSKSGYERVLFEEKGKDKKMEHRSKVRYYFKIYIYLLLLELVSLK